MIAKKKVMEPRKLSLPIYRYAALTAGCVEFVCLSAFGVFTGEAIGALFLYIFVPVFLIASVVINNNLQLFEKRVLRFQAELFAEAAEIMIREVGHAPRFIDFSMHPSHKRDAVIAAAIGYDDKKLYIIEHGILGVIHWSDVREYSKNIEGYNQTLTHEKDLSARTRVINMNRDAYQTALLASGIFINVADVEKPTWQFVCDDNKILEKWFEILTQINEGKLDPITQ